jgi:hypothetical protein
METIGVVKAERGEGKRLPLVLSPALLDESVLLPDSARTNGIFLIAPTGWGKSLWLANQAHQDLMRGTGTVVLDAVGGTIDNCLNKLLYLPEHEQRALAKRVVYCNMAGLKTGDSTYDTLVTAWPMLYRKDRTESLDVTSQRIVDLIAKTNKALASAGIQGLPRVEAMLTSIFQVLTALDLPVSYAIDFLQNPESWRERIELAGRLHPEIQRSKNRLLMFLDLSPTTQQSWAEVILNRLQRIEFDVVAEAMFSAPTPLVDWDDVVDQGKQVLIDLRYEKSQKAKELKLFWVWGSIYEYIKGREANGRERPPLSVVIDELSFFVRGTSLNKGVITEEFRELIQVYKRNANIWFTAATQEVGELPSELARACLKCGTHLYGAIDSPDTAKRLTSRRRWDVTPQITGYKRDVPVFETVQDIQKAYAEQLQGLKKGQWLAAVSQEEGEPATHLELIETGQIDQGMWVKKPLVDKLKRYFMERDGALVRDILKPAAESKKPSNLLDKREEKKMETKQQSSSQEDAVVIGEPQESPAEAPDTSQPETPQRTKAKDRRRRIEES